MMMSFLMDIGKIEVGSSVCFTSGVGTRVIVCLDVDSSVVSVEDAEVG
jgi:hypothetical protein